MSKAITQASRIFIENLAEKSEELNSKCAAFKRMGLLSGCPEVELNKFFELIKEIRDSSKGLESMSAISQGN